MKRIGFAIAAVLLLVATTAPADGTRRTVTVAESGKARVGRPAPWLSGWTLGDEVFNLAKAFQDPATRRVALVFFATWCAPCKAGIQTLKAEAQRLRAAGVQVVLVDYQDRPEQVRQYLNGAACPFPVVLDPFGKTKGSYLEPSGDRVVLPRTVLVGRDLAVEAIFSEEGDDYVDRIVAGR